MPQFAALQPQLRLTAPGASGSSLALPANWTADRAGLTATTPGAGQPPLAAGQYTVQAPLNGGQDFSGGSSDQPMVRIDVHSRCALSAVGLFALCIGLAAGVRAGPSLPDCGCTFSASNLHSSEGSTSITSSSSPAISPAPPCNDMPI